MLYQFQFLKQNNFNTKIKMEQKKQTPSNVGESISVLIQVAELAQKSGILNLEDASIVKASIDILVSALKQPEPVEEGPVA